MHVRPNERQRAFRKLVTLLKPGGFVALSFRSPDPNPSRGMFPAATEEIERSVVWLRATGWAGRESSGVA